MKNNFSFPVLEHPAPACDSKRAIDLAKSWMELDNSTTITPLVSERDRNFLISTNEEKAILKISNHKEERGVLEFQIEALLYLQETTSLNLPKAKKNIDGEYLMLKDVGGEDCYVRIVSYLEGIPLDDVRAKIPDPRELHLSMGTFLAKLGNGLDGFSHPNENHRLLWDVAQTENLFDLLDNIQDEQKRKMAERALIYYQDNTKELLSKQRKQVIHNDMNPDNVLVTKEGPSSVVGMIDFGDMLHAPLINDLAVACAYEAIRTESLFSGSKDLLQGYHNENKLSESEIMLLSMLTYNRIAMSLIISEWRSRKHPENREYILGNIEYTWAIFKDIKEEEIEKVGNSLAKSV
tara:strand:- start:1981 stop:3030 length:1050 start_codon:yes stop_codon:yes gene_type:complete